MTEPKAYTKKDFELDIDIRWCPGCGDYAILSAVQKALPLMNVEPWKVAFVSGIGCSSRFPYYMNTYGFHTIHGRAPTIASGLKLAQPDLSVWVVTGDGDGFSIGTNHLVHLFRRNLDINVLLINNQIYGLTKGQYSPTSEQHKHSKTSPYGSIDYPLNPSKLALASGASFVARGIDVDAEGLINLLVRAKTHEGTSFIEIFQNCHVFNDKVFASFAEKAHRKSKSLFLIPGEAMIFGNDKEHGLSYQNQAWHIVSAQEADVYRADSVPLAMSLLELPYPAFPMIVGVLYAQARPAFEVLLEAKREEVGAKHPVDIQQWISGSYSWEA